MTAGGFGLRDPVWRCGSQSHDLELERVTLRIHTGEFGTAMCEVGRCGREEGGKLVSKMVGWYEECC